MRIYDTDNPDRGTDLPVQFDDLVKRIMDTGAIRNKDGKSLTFTGSLDTKGDLALDECALDRLIQQLSTLAQ